MKVLHTLGGRSMIGHVVAAARGVGAARVVAVIGHQREAVAAHLAEIAPDVLTAVQEKQHGTGHAVACAVAAVPAITAGPGTVVVATGDTPLLTAETLAAFVAEHRASQAAVSILSGVVADPTGMGRILRTDDGEVTAIVEEKDATPLQRDIAEVNSGILAFDAAFLAEVLPRLGNDNAGGEYYLTDAVGLARADGLAVAAHPVADVDQTEGVNDRVQLARLRSVLNRRVLEGWMRAGVTVVDPATTWVDVDVELAPDVVLHPQTQLHGTTRVAEGAEIGPDTTLRDCVVGAEARVVRCHGEQARIEAGATVGPFAYLRPGAEVGEGGKVGTFVEVKNSVLGAGAKVPHLSYVGDAEIGEGTNIGAGTIFANYDGVAKHRTRVGRHARTGSNNTFVAPVDIGDGAGTGAGTVVRRDVPPGALAVTSGPQRNLPGWAVSRRPGTDQAKAAAAALAESDPAPDTPTAD